MFLLMCLNKGLEIQTLKHTWVSLFDIIDLPKTHWTLVAYTRNKVQLQFSVLGSAVLQASHVPCILHISAFIIYMAGRIN